MLGAPPAYAVAPLAAAVAPREAPSVPAPAAWTSKPTAPPPVHRDPSAGLARPSTSLAPSPPCPSVPAGAVGGSSPISSLPVNPPLSSFDRPTAHSEVAPLARTRAILPPPVLVSTDPAPTLTVARCAAEAVLPSSDASSSPALGAEGAPIVASCGLAVPADLVDQASLLANARGSSSSTPAASTAVLARGVAAPSTLRPVLPWLLLRLRQVYTRLPRLWSLPRSPAILSKS